MPFIDKRWLTIRQDTSNIKRQPVFFQPWIYDDDREIVTEQKPFQKGWTENMRKKSHISLARYIVANTEDEGLKKQEKFW